MFDAHRRATIAYTAPFAAFVLMMALERALKLPAGVYYPGRLLIVTALLLTVSRRVVPWPPSRFWASAMVGALVFVVWVAPDLLFGYRDSWLFSNFVTGGAESSVPVELRRTIWFPLLRSVSCTLLVPVLEELFWRGWMIRWLVAHNFTKVPYTVYVRSAFWIVVLLFASEHGPYWEVGLAAGAIYNWWLLRTGNLADTIVAHAVTNGILSVYIVLSGQWQYWL